MPLYLALLRGINIGPHNKIPMAEFRALLADLGFGAVQTYIQTGNAWFETEDTPPAALAERISTGIQDTFGFPIQTLVLTHARYRDIVAGNPYTQTTPAPDIKNLYLTLLWSAPEESRLQALTLPPTNGATNGDTYHLVGDVLYLCFPNGYGQTALANPFWEKAFKIHATTRNWNTATKLLAMVE